MGSTLPFLKVSTICNHHPLLLSFSLITFNLFNFLSLSLSLSLIPLSTHFSICQSPLLHPGIFVRTCLFPLLSLSHGPPSQPVTLHSCVPPSHTCHPSPIQHPPFLGATNKSQVRSQRANKAYMERESVCC